MSGGIDEPYSIAHLPKPLDPENGRLRAAPVHTISASSTRKRKRHEVVVGIDGECVNIYNIQNQSISSSYALPPHTYLAAPPCSVYCKRARLAPSQRQTYLATRDGPHEQKLRLVNITQDLGRPHTDEYEHEPRAPARRERKLRSGHIVGLDVVSTPQSAAASVLVSYANGSVDCLSGDLSGTRWEHTATNESGEVEHAVVIDYAVAQRGLLKGREDILARFQTNSNSLPTSDAPPLLLQVRRSSSRRHICLFALRNTVREPLSAHRDPLDELLTYELPSRRKLGDKEACYELHAGTGMLYQRIDGQLNIFDLSGTVPRIAIEFGRKGKPRVDSFVRLSSASVLTVNSDRITVCETKFGSVLSSLEFPPREVDRGANQRQIPLNIISRFTDLGIVIAMSGANLVVFQVGDILDDGRRARARGPLLIDVLGKGNNKFDDQSPSEPSKKQLTRRRKWEDWTAKVDLAVSDGDVRKLDEILAQDLHLGLSKDHDHDDEVVNDLVDSATTSSTDHVWTLPSWTYDSEHVSSKKALYMLGALFTWRLPGMTVGPNLKLNLASPPKNVLRWLAVAGYLTRDQLERAIFRSPAGFKSSSRVAQGDILAALKDVDPTFDTICDLLSLPIHWDLEEVVHGLKILIRSFEAKSPAAHDNPALEAPDSDGLMVDSEENARFEAEVDAATRQLDEAQSILETGLANRSKTCQVLLFRLHAFPTADVTRTMHDILTQDELIFFIAILRLELGDAGWTRKYVEAEQAIEQEFPLSNLDNSPELEPSNQAIRTVADLCCCAIDAIGLSGWLVGLSGDIVETARLVNETRNEVSAAAEGLVGVEVVDMLLREVMKTAGSIDQAGHKLKRKRSDGEELVSEESTLPLGGRLEAPQLKSWKTRDEIPSKQAIAEKKSRSVGKYSLERIRF